MDYFNKNTEYITKKTDTHNSGLVFYYNGLTERGNHEFTSKNKSGINSKDSIIFTEVDKDYFFAKIFKN